MKRAGFLRSLAGIIAAPSVLAEVEAAPPISVDEIFIPLEKLPEGATIGARHLCFVSAIDFLDLRDIDPKIYDQPQGVTDIENIVNRFHKVK